MQLSDASTKSYIKAIYLLLLHYLSYLKPADCREIGLNVKSAVSSGKPSQQAEGQLSLEYPAGSQEGNWH